MELLCIENIMGTGHYKMYNEDGSDYETSDFRFPVYKKGKTYNILDSYFHMGIYGYMIESTVYKSSQRIWVYPEMEYWSQYFKINEVERK